MTHSDSDIQDLFDHLHGVGLAETSAEEAERIHKVLWKDYAENQDLHPDVLPSIAFVESALRRGIPHTYITVFFSPGSQQLGLRSLRVFPVVRGHVLYQGGVTSLEVLKEKQESEGNLVFLHPDLPSLQDSLYTIHQDHPYLSIDKFSALLGS